MDRVYCQRILGFFPIYVDNIGDCTQVLIEGEDYLVIEKTIATFLKLILRYYMIDLGEIRDIYSKYTNSRNLVPIPFDSYNIFIPFKARRPIYENDRAFGYFNLNYVEDFLYGPSGVLVVFRDGQSLKCISREKTFRKHLKNGKIVKLCYEKREMPRPNRQEDRLRTLIDEIKDIIKNN